MTSRLIPGLAAFLWSGVAGFAEQALLGSQPLPLAYDQSAWELSPEFRQPKPWTTNDLRNEILERIRFEKQRRELDVYYYRIGFTMSYPLELDHRLTAKELPVPISTLTYPWMTWLSWAREERWRLLHYAWRELNDQEAGRLLQREMAALANWDRFGECDGNIGLLTGHTAAVLALVLAHPQGWEPGPLKAVQSAAESLVERDAWPWFQERWVKEPLTPLKLANIPVIALARSAQLARVLKSQRRDVLEGRTREVLRAWCRFRAGAEHHTEGVAYDGYLFDTLTEWINGLPDRDVVVKESRGTLRSLADSWLALIVPGRADLHAPLADVEPEMTFWITALARIARYHPSSDITWLLHQVPPARFRAAALVAALEQPGITPAIQHSNAPPSPLPPPPVQPTELAYAVSLRSGWDEADLLAAVGLSRSVMSHLQADGGQVILAWHGRCWITDPGYQQYRPGEERDYTLGLQAHNAPVIDGVMETERLARLEVLETDASGHQHARLDLSKCYRGLPAGAMVARDVWLAGQEGLVVRDSFKGLRMGAKVSNSWLGAYHMGWASCQGWARLSDGRRALWIGTNDGELQNARLHRHPGTRGPLTLTHTGVLTRGEGERWWVFACDRACGWGSPLFKVEQGSVTVKLPGENAATWSVR